MIPLRLSAFVCGLGLLSSAAPPLAQGTEDPYAWLEESGSSRTEAFYREHDAQARDVLGRIAGRGPLLARLQELSAMPRVTAVSLGGPRVFYLAYAAGTGEAHLAMREGGTGPERVLLEPAPARIAWASPSPDGRHVAVGLQQGGATRLRVLAVDGGKWLPEEIGDAAALDRPSWQPDGRAFYYSRAGGGGAGAARIYRHVPGRAAERDELVFAPGVGGALGVPERAQALLHVPLESRFAYATVQAGEGRSLAVYAAEQRDLAAGRPRWRKVASPEEGVLAIEGWKDDLYVLSRHGAPRHRVLRVKAGGDLSAARVAVPEGDSVIRSMALARDALYLRTMVAGVDRLERLPLGLLAGSAVQFVRTPFDVGITELLANPRVEGAWLQVEGWIDPPALLQVDRHGELHRAPLQPAAAAEPPPIEEVRLYAPSTEGVKIPVTLLYRKSTRLTRDNPTLVEAYGSYGATLSPVFDPAHLAWIEAGGVLAIAHVRGGGEYGETWHEAGREARKANSIADVAAVSEFLQGYGFASPRRLAVMGSGAGVIAAAGAFVKRPDLFAALVARAPLADLVRAAQADPASQEEFGADPAALAASSPYQLVRPTMPYPAALVIVQPGATPAATGQAAKLVARLQAATSSGRPVLLRLEAAVADPREAHDEELADIFAFLLWQMGERRFQGPPPAAAGPAPPAREPVAQ
jgi:prolyl oligopeptidase